MQGVAISSLCSKHVFTEFSTNRVCQPALEVPKISHVTATVSGGVGNQIQLRRS
jgi:hypothetical protein